MQKKIVLSFGRMNPPTVGHQKLVDKINDVARARKAIPALYLSHSQDKKKNPLSYTDKIRYTQKAFGKIVKRTRSRTIIEVLKELDGGGWSEVTIVVGSDRIKEFTALVNRYNGKEYSFDKIDVISAGERDPDSDGVEGMSASKLRELAVAGNMKEFRAGIPARLRQSRDGADMYNKIREAMGVREESLDEVLNIQQRMKKKMAMRRIKAKIKLGKKRAKFRMAKPEKLKARSRKVARELLRKRLAGKQGENYRNLPLSGRMQIDKRLEKKKAQIAKLAQRLMPKVRKAEMERLKKARMRREELDVLSAVDTILDESLFDTISKKVEQNLQKKSDRWGVDISELRDLYRGYKYDWLFEETEKDVEEYAFDELNHEIASRPKFGLYQNRMVPLDRPMVDEVMEEKDVELNKPKRGGPKKFYVYVKDPQTGNVKKVTFGDTSGLKAKINDPKARASFAARHKCAQKTDKTSPGYWACRLPRYAKSLGLEGGGGGWW